MTPKKRIPKGAAAWIDEAKMDVSATIHELMPMVECRPLSPEEKVGIPARIVIRLHGTMGTLEALRALVKLGDQESKEA